MTFFPAVRSSANAIPFLFRFRCPSLKHFAQTKDGIKKPKSKKQRGASSRPLKADPIPHLRDSSLFAFKNIATFYYSVWLNLLNQQIPKQLPKNYPHLKYRLFICQNLSLNFQFFLGLKIILFLVPFREWIICKEKPIFKENSCGILEGKKPCPKQPVGERHFFSRIEEAGQ